MHRRSTTRAARAAAAVCLPLLAAGCATSGLARSPGVGNEPVTEARPEAREFVISAAVFAGPAAVPSSTFQGVFSDPLSGEPIDGPATIRIGIAEGPLDSDPILSLTDVSPQYTSGRFTADIPLLPPEEMLLIEDPHICVLSADGNDTPLIPRLPIRHAPYAWAAEFAQGADTARFADSAESALFAQNASTAVLASQADSANSAISAQTAETAESAFFAEEASRIAGSFIVDLTPGVLWTASATRPPRATRIGDLVFLSGAFEDGPNFPFSQILELPANLRPAYPREVIALTTDAMNRLEIRVDGNVLISDFSGNGLLSLDGIVYSVAP